MESRSLDAVLQEQSSDPYSHRLATRWTKPKVNDRKGGKVVEKKDVIVHNRN